MGAFNEQYLKKCPFCNGDIKDDSYDRRIVFRCVNCNIVKSYPGLLQTEVSSVPIPYSDGNGGYINPEDIKVQEYYHQFANEIAVEEFNKWVDTENIKIVRDYKISDVLGDVVF